jgi:hypothetical protein
VRIFLAERTAPDMDQIAANAMHRILAAASRRLTESGTPVRLLRSNYLPTQHRWIGTFAATTPHDVGHAIDIAQLAAVQVSEAIEITAPTES